MLLMDPVSDLLTRIRNAKSARHRYVDIINSRLIKEIVEVLKEAGFIENYLTSDNKRTLRVFLKYAKNRESVIQGIKRLSKPGLRKYVGYKKIPTVLGGLGISILSTPCGVVSGSTAKKNKAGGELLCCVW
ncbi:30S ribosomal protein S8 [Candidatus Aerophobetes bacterium]|uniref:Small ribosomal subunit protein uS8 n=1 Tax=Aerophobetes bacterium TaxID=2030807 RepID=A0A2A4YMW5_UNCAE|nr:MAG: 30S ribosomal protein S8 [Candidatus Aerophobetes bacterium]